MANSTIADDATCFICNEPGMLVACDNEPGCSDPLCLLSPRSFTFMGLERQLTGLGAGSTFYGFELSP